MDDQFLIQCEEGICPELISEDELVFDSGCVLAVQHGHLRLLECLAQKRPIKFQRLIYIAIKYSRVEIISYLCNSYDIDYDALYVQCKRKSIDFSKILNGVIHSNS
jgi:hypothetical protein